VIIAGLLTGGDVHDSVAAAELIEPLNGCAVIADRGYDTNRLRAQLINQNCEPVIPGRINRKTKIIYNKSLYKIRGLIERLFGKIKENRRLAMRFEKSDINLLGFVAMALIKINL